MAELIDREALKEALLERGFYPAIVKGVLESAPSVDSVKHGWWKQTTESLGWDEIECVECSECQESWIIDEDFGIDDVSELWNYCPSCGAKMDGECDE